MGRYQKVRELTVREYAELKLSILRSELKIPVDEYEVYRLLHCNTEIAVDNCARQIINDHWG